MNQEELLASRYGKKPRNKGRDRLAIISGALVALVAFLIWAIAVTADSSGKPTGNLLSYTVDSPTKISVEVSANNHRNQDVLCQVEALASDYEVVAYKEVLVAKGQDVAKASLTSVKPAVSAVVKDCWFK
ncbi:MAG: hypothetical protein RLZZ471_1047 [Actinomycetota bacterium]